MSDQEQTTISLGLADMAIIIRDNGMQEVVFPKFDDASEAPNILVILAAFSQAITHGSPTLYTLVAEMQERLAHDHANDTGGG